MGAYTKEKSTFVPVVLVAAVGKSLSLLQCVLCEN